MEEPHCSVSAIATVDHHRTIEARIQCRREKQPSSPAAFEVELDHQGIIAAACTDCIGCPVLKLPVLVRHIEGDGPTVFAHACNLGLEGIVSKRKDSTYRSGRSPDWLKIKNPAAPAVQREAEEDWKR